MVPSAIIYNPVKATRKRLAQAVSNAAKGLPEAKISWHPTTASSHGGEQVLEALAKGIKHIIISGGDGTIRNVVQALVEAERTDASISLIPTGTGNILARNLKINVPGIDANMKRALFGDTHRIDIGQVRAVGSDGNSMTAYFTGIAGIGMDARMMQRTESALKRRVGWVAYIEGGIRSLPFKFEKFDVQVDDSPVRNLKSYSLLVGNAGWLPGLLSMMPDARLDDGRLDVAAIGPRKIWNWVDFFSRITWQNNVVRPLALGRKWMDATANLKTMENLNGARIQIRPHHPALMQLDGDPIGEMVEIEFRVMPLALALRL